MKEYTDHFDSGFTHIFGGGCISKDSPLVEAYGAIDELNTLIGLSRSLVKNPEISGILKEIQKDLLVIGADLSNPKKVTIKGKENKLALTSEHVKKMETLIQQMESELPALTNFILPTGSPAAAVLQVARVHTRKAERRVVAAKKLTTINMDVLRYLNRLSDFLFTVSRYINLKEEGNEEVWE